MRKRKKNTAKSEWDKLCLNYILDYCYYLRAGDDDTSAKAEVHLKKAIELATEDYERFKGNKDGDENIFLDLVVLSYRSIGYTYFIDGGGDPDRTVPINFDYLRVSKENFHKASELYYRYKGKLDEIDNFYPKNFEKVNQHLKRINQLLRTEDKAEAKKF